MKVSRGLLLALALVCPLGQAVAQTYPSKPVTVIVPFAPGGATDIVARITARVLTESLGQSFVVDNRPGAGGMLALEMVARAPADGYTLLIPSTGPAR